jgi:hypothetical protein
MAKKTDVEIVIKANANEADQTLDELKKKGEKTFNKAIPESVKDGNKKIKDSFKTLGIVTEAQVKKTNAKLRESYRILKESGTQSAAELKRAHTAMTAQIKANNKKIESGNKRLRKSFKSLKSAILPITLAITGIGFAIRRAFEFAQTGAKLKQQELAFRNLADSTGQDADKILKNLKEISKGTLTTAQIIESANLAVLLGIPIEKLDELMAIARAAAKATGQSVQQQFDDIVRGIGRQSRLILDNLGIIVSTLVANQRFAEQLGINAKDLTDAQRAQAFLNETTRKGQRITEIVGEEYQSANDVLANFVTTLKDAADWVSKVTARLVALFIVDIKKGLLFIQKSFQATTGLIFKFTDAIGLTSNAFKEQQDDIAEVDKKLAELNKTTKGLNKSNKELTEKQKALNKARADANKLTEQEEAAIKAKIAAEKEALELQIEAEKKKKEAIDTNIQQLRVTTRLSKSAVATQKDLVQKLKGELLDAEESIRRALALQAETERIRAKRRKGPSGQARIDLEFARQQISDIDRLIVDGDVVAAKQLANEIIPLIEDVARAEGISSKVIQEAETLSDIVVDQMMQIRDLIKESKDVELKKELNLEAELTNNNVKMGAFKLLIKESADEAERLKKTLAEIETPIIGKPEAGAAGKRFNSGGLVGGKGGTDTNAAMLTKGEVVLNKNAVDKIGVANALAINNLQTPDLGGASNGTSVNVKLDVGGRKVSLQGSGKEVDKLVKEIRNLNIKKGRYESRY